MKKLFTLLTLLLCAVTGVWADVVWESDFLETISGVTQTKGRSSDTWGDTNSLTWASGTYANCFNAGGSSSALTFTFSAAKSVPAGSVMHIYWGATSNRTLSLQINNENASFEEGNAVDNSTKSTIMDATYTFASTTDLSSFKIMTNGSNTYWFHVSILSAAASYSVTYKANGGNGSDVESTTSVVEACTFTAPAGKIFVGWNTAADGSGTAYAVGESVSSDLTLYAQWAKLAQKILYSLADGIGSAEVTASEATVNTGTSLVLTNSSGRIKLTAATGEQFKAGDDIAFSGAIGNTGKNYGVKYGTTTKLADGSICVAGTTHPLAASGTLSIGSASENLYIGRYDGTTTTLTSLVISRTLVMKSEGFAGVKIDGVVATEGDDYTVSGTTITLTDSYVAVPTVALISRITFIDESTSDTPVNVELTKDGAFFTGTATINDVTYTVKVPVSSTPTLEADVTAVSVVSTMIGKDSKVVKLIGANLTGAASITFASTVAGLTVSPATIIVTDGAVNQEFTVSYQSDSDVAEATVNLTFAVGEKSVVVPVTYSSTAAVTTITDVTGSKSWDFSGAASADVTPLDANKVIPFANTTGSFNTGFDYKSLAGQAQYFYYKSNKCFQGSELKFHTTVPGIVTVVYSNTGNRSDVASEYRYLYINGVKADDKGSISASTKNTVENYAVAAGDVVLTGIQGESTPNMLRIYSVKFVETIDITPAKDMSTYVTSKILDFSDVDGLKAYAVSAITASSATLTEVTTAPAGEGLLLMGTAATKYSVPVAASASTITNKLKAAVTATDVAADEVYVLNGGKFHKVTAASTVPAGKAYLLASDVPASAASLALDFDGTDEHTTGIENVEAQKSFLDGEFYNLAGQRVAQPAKGLYIVNGKKVVIK